VDGITHKNKKDKTRYVIIQAKAVLVKVAKLPLSTTLAVKATVRVLLVEVATVTEAQGTDKIVLL
jgi:hypothetical protein